MNSLFELRDLTRMILIVLAIGFLLWLAGRDVKGQAAVEREVLVAPPIVLIRDFGGWDQPSMQLYRVGDDCVLRTTKHNEGVSMVVLKPSSCVWRKP